MNKLEKYVILVVIFITMIFCFLYGCNSAGCACAFLFIVLYCIKGNIKEINASKGTISFYNIKEAELFIKSPNWVKSSLDIKKIRQNQINDYKELKLQRSLQLTSPFNYYRKKTVDTLKEYQKYINMGYYPFTTIDIVEASNYDVLILLLNLFKNAKECKNSGKVLKNIIPKLPANEIQFVEPLDEIEKHKDENIEEFLKDEKVSIKTKSKQYDIVIFFDDGEKEFVSFIELLRADFYGKGYEEILLTKYYHSAGTLQLYEPMLLRNVGGSFFVVPIEEKQSLKLKFIKFITESKYMRPLFKLISIFVKDNVNRGDYFNFGD